MKLASTSSEISLKKIKKDYEEAKPGQTISISTIHSILKKTNQIYKSFFVDEFISNSDASKEARCTYAERFVKFNNINCLYTGVLVIDLSSNVFTPISYGEFNCKGSIYIMITLYNGGLINHVIQTGTMQTKVFDTYLSNTLKETQSHLSQFEKGGCLICDCSKYLEESRVSLIGSQFNFETLVIPAFSSFLSPIEYLRRRLNDRIIVNKADQEALVSTVISALDEVPSSEYKIWIENIIHNNIKTSLNKEDFTFDNGLI